VQHKALVEGHAQVLAQAHEDRHVKVQQWLLLPPGTAQAAVEQIRPGEAQDVGQTPPGTVQAAVEQIRPGEAPAVGQTPPGTVQEAVKQYVQVKPKL
jgi:hypothetical protein